VKIRNLSWCVHYAKIDSLLIWWLADHIWYMLLSDRKNNNNPISDIDLKFYIHTAITNYNSGQMPTLNSIYLKMFGECFLWRF
jgi:hypothetical protein